MYGIVQGHIDKMNKIVLSINGVLFCIPSDRTGVISVCNNKYGNELACVISGISDNRASLNIGASVCIRMIAFEGVELTHEFVIPDFSNKERELVNATNMYGIEVCARNNTICIPFIDGGAVTFVVTINRGIVSIDAGSITTNNILLDYYHSELNIGDEIRVTLKKLDFISSPLRERFF